MWSQRNSQRRLQSSIRAQLASDLHDSLAQDLVAIGFKLDLLVGELPFKHRAKAREIRFAVSDATKRVRRELFALRSPDGTYYNDLIEHAQPLQLLLNGELSKLDAKQRRVVDELVRNAAQHSKGHAITIDIGENSIKVRDDGMGFHGISRLVEEFGGEIKVTSSGRGTQVEIALP